MENNIDEKTQNKVMRLFQTISYPTRIQILYALSDKTMSVNEIALAVNLEQSAVSHQLKILKNEDLVRSKRNGKSMEYSIADEHIFKIFDMAIDHVREGGHND